MNKLAIIDWGIGGVSVHKLIKQRIGDIPTIYFSDTGATPYGKMSRRELFSRVNTVIRFLKSHGVTHIVIGCNAASTAIPQLSDHGVKIEGVIDAAVTATAELQPKRLGLIGGRRTVRSGIYRRAFAARELKVSQRVAQPLSGLIESGDVSSDLLRRECSRILAPLRNSTHILLACTHYPAITSVLRDFVSNETVFVDPVPSLVAKVARWCLDRRGEQIFLTTGDPAAMKTAAKAAFDVQINEVERVCV